jgi:hypothetical protein
LSNIPGPRPFRPRHFASHGATGRPNPAQARQGVPQLSGSHPSAARHPLRIPVRDVGRASLQEQDDIATSSGLPGLRNGGSGCHLVRTRPATFQAAAARGEAIIPTARQLARTL